MKLKGDPEMTVFPPLKLKAPISPDIMAATVPGVPSVVSQVPHPVQLKPAYPLGIAALQPAPRDSKSTTVSWADAGALRNKVKVPVIPIIPHSRFILMSSLR